MNYINENDRIKCHTIIHGASIAAGVTGAGLCWLPGSDAPVISAAQITMAVSLGKVFGIKLSKSAAKAAVAAAAATLPMGLPAASRTYHLRSTVSAFAIYVDIANSSIKFS